MRRRLTNKQLREFVEYNPNTGIFSSVKTNMPVGTITAAGHVVLRINGVRYLCEKLAWFYMTNQWPEYGITHINGVLCDNWTDNLKKNKKIKRKDNKSGIPGVSIDKQSKKYRTQIFINGRQKNLGNFKDFDSAVIARYEAEQEMGRSSNTPAHRHIKKMFLSTTEGKQGVTFDEWTSSLKKNERVVRKNSKTGVTGVYKTEHDTWVVQMSVNGKQRHLGTFKNFDSAVLARCEAEVQHGYVSPVDSPAKRYIDQMFF